MNAIVGFFVGILQAVFSMLGGVSAPIPAAPDSNYQTPPPQAAMSPQDVVAQYGTLPHGISDSSQTSANTPGTTAPALPKSYCTADNYSVKDGVEYWGANPLKDADPNTFEPLPPFPQDGGFDLCLAEDATHVFVSRDLVLPRPDHITYLPLQGTKNCNGYRVVDGLGVFEGVWLLAGADVHTFVDITPPDGYKEGMCYGKDAQHVYSFTGFRAIAGADPATFQVLNANYTKDANQVWYRGGLFDNYGPMPLADVNTFVVLSETYAKDANHAYHMESVIAGADPATFAALDDNHSKDATHVYDFFGKPYPGIDGATAVSLDSGAWLKDASHVYLSDGTLVPEADTKTFVALGGGYGKDAQHIFYTDAATFGSQSNVVSGADLATFTVKDGYAQDASHIFSGSAILADADVATFAKIGSSMYYKDAEHVWYQSETGRLAEISGADAASFTTTDSVEYGSAKDATHTYGFDAKGRFYSTPITTGSPTADVSVPGMSKYTDDDFGFSFWYPSGWTVTQATVQNPSIYPGGTVSKQYQVSDGHNTISLQEFTSPTYSITDSTGVGACPVCNTTHYYFDANQHTWMVEYPNGTNTGASGAPAPANVSANTMGGLHMLYGSQRFGANVIIPLSARNFVIVTVDGGIATGSSNAQALAKTIVASDPAVATPVSIAQQQISIEAEENAYTEQ